MSLAPTNTATQPVPTRSAAALVAPVVLALTVPLVGFLTSLLLPLLAARARPQLWPQASPSLGHLCSALAVIGLWLPAALAVASGGRLGSETTTWLILPLCAPTGAALVVPAAVAAAAYLLGLTAGVRARSPWPWVVGAWAAPLAYAGAARWLVDFACVA